MKKYAFIHEAEHISESLGISEKRHQEIFHDVKEAFRENDPPSMIMEAAINAAQPKNDVEAMYIGFVVSDIIQKFKAFQENPAAAILAALGKS